MDRSYARELEVAVEVVRGAAALCAAVQRDLAGTVHEKDDRSPVTVADYGSQALICRALGEAFPDDPVIAEEDSAALREAANAGILEQVVARVAAAVGDANAETVCRWIDRGGTHDHRDRFWTLDPIDGTKGFLRGEQYAVALALVVDGEVTVAALACPNLPRVPGRGDTAGTVFSAAHGQGAWAWSANGTGERIRLRVSETDDPAAARLCESVESGHSSHGAAQRVAGNLGLTAPPVRLDSQAKYAVVARGEADIYLRLPTRADYREKIWDHAGGCLVVTEAGGAVTDVAGRPLDFSHGRRLETNRGVVASNGRLHERVLAALEAER